MSKLQDLVLELWKPNSTRSRYGEFKPVFERFVGFDDEREYNDICATIEASKDASTIIIDGNLAFRPRLDLLAQIKKELPHIQFDRITPQDLTMFADPEQNAIYLRALMYVYGLAKRNGRFQNRRQEENFILNQIVYSIDYLLGLRFEADYAPKVICYERGELEERGFWFLMLCYVMGMDVLVLEAAGSGLFWGYDLDHLSNSSIGLRRSKQYSFATRVSLGHKIDKVKTTVSLLSSQIGDSLFMDTGVFQPWMYREKPMKEVQIEGTRIDLEQGWKQEARFREGFAADENSITIPTFYMEIDGVDSSREEYARTLEKLEDAPDLIIDTLQGTSLLRPLPEAVERFKLVYDMNPDGTFSFDKLKARKGYVFDQMSDEVGRRFVDTLNAMLKESPKLLSKEERLKIATILLSLSKPVARLIENQDFPFQVPKILLFLFKEDKVVDEMQIVLPFLKRMGFDIAIFTPAGVSGLSDSSRTRLRLEKMDYDMVIPPQPPKQESTAREKEKQNGFLSLFGLKGR